MALLRLDPRLSAAPRRRRTQAERSAATRRLLLDATIECLVEQGYAGTSTTSIAERAGVSRGAQVHHFPSKAELVAEAVEHLADRRLDELGRAAATLPAGAERPRAALDLLWSMHSGPLFDAAAELWVAARTDAAMRERLIPVEARLSASILELSRGLFGSPAADRAWFPTAIRLALNSMIGLGMTREWSSAREGERMWAFTRERLVEQLEVP